MEVQEIERKMGEKNKGQGECSIRRWSRAGKRIAKKEKRAEINA